MSHTLQLDPPISVDTLHGEGWAIFFTEWGVHENSVFTVANKKTGRIRHYTLRHLKLSPNHTFEIRPTKEVLKV